MTLRTLFILLAVWPLPSCSNATTDLARHPYLQQTTTDSVVVRWRTEQPSQNRLTYRETSSATVIMRQEAQPTTEHEIALTGLAADTQYFYTITQDDGIVVTGENYFFSTSPPSSTTDPIRIWVVGDAGGCSQSERFCDNVARVKSGFETASQNTTTDLLLMLGDNAYPDGTDREFTLGLFQEFENFIRQMPLWPVLGNHDARSADSTNQSGPYFSAFTLPTQGEAGGTASNTEAYYSFDSGNIHFIALDSSTSALRQSSSAMLTWLAQDLSQNSADWTIAFWHHPPYSNGSHDSDREGELIEMRSNVVPLLESAGVDLVLSGHSHGYERSMLIDSHYGPSSSFVSGTHALNSGDGDPKGDGAYSKPSIGPAAHEGTVYAVVGSASKLVAPASHPAMKVTLNSLGSMVIDISGNTLNARFIDDNGSTRDSFQIIKGIP